MLSRLALSSRVVVNSIYKTSRRNMVIQKPLVSLISVPATSTKLKGAAFFSTDDLDPHGGYERLSPAKPEDKMQIFITDRNGKEHTVDCKVGDNLLFLCRVLQEKTPELYLEGACEASLACSTCHVIIDDENLFEILPEASEQEEDMLDMASCLSPTSRLACQVTLTKDLDGMHVTLPKFSRNFYVDGHIPQPH